MDIVEPTAGLEQRTNSMTAMEKKCQWLLMAGGCLWGWYPES